MEVYLYLREFPTQPEAPRTGPMKAVSGLAAGLVTAGANVSILCEGPRDVELQENGYRLLGFKNRLLPSRFLLAPSLKRFLEQRFNGGLVVLNGLFNPSLYSLAEWLRRREIPYVAASHSSYHPALFGRRPYVKWPYWYLFERSFLRGAAGIQVLDIRQREFIANRGVHRPAFEVTNGLALSDAPAEEQLRWSSTGPAKFMYFGRLDTYTKGLDLLVRAFDRLSAPTPLTLTLQGPPSHQYSTLLRTIAKADRRDSMRVVEGDFQSSAPEVLNRYDVICFPSRYEGFGLAALEAMIAGRVLLVSRSSGIAPHVEAAGCGLLVDPDVDKIQEALTRLLCLRPQWRDMGLSGRRYALANLRWDAIAQGALAHYSMLVNHKVGDELPLPVARVDSAVGNISESR